MDAPHDTQKRACGGASVLQERQTRLKACAQDMQKRASEGFSSPHDGQRMVARFVASALRQRMSAILPVSVVRHHPEACSLHSNAVRLAE